MKRLYLKDVNYHFAVQKVKTHQNCKLIRNSVEQSANPQINNILVVNGGLMKISPNISPHVCSGVKMGLI